MRTNFTTQTRHPSRRRLRRWRYHVGGFRESLFTHLYSHAAAWRNLASVSVPGDLRLGEAADARRRNHCAVSLGDRLDSFALLETSHNCAKTKTGGECETARCFRSLPCFWKQQSAAGRSHGAHRGPVLVNLGYSRFILRLPHYIFKADRKLR